METPIDHLTKLYGAMTEITNKIKPLAERVVNLEAKTISQEASIVLLMGYIMSKDSNGDFVNHLKYASTSNNYTDVVKTAASEILRQKTLWQDELMNKAKQ
jgi:hypothetical protein